MFRLDTLVRKNIQALAPYSSARDEFSGAGQIYLDANENPFGQRNRYPDSRQIKLKEVVSEQYGVLVNQVFVGNGSDEVIDVLCRIFCCPGKDKILTFSPTYGMYKVSAQIQDITVIEIPLTAGFQIDFKRLEEVIDDPALKIIFLCSPNNPTGNLMKHMEEICQRFRGIVVVDEAYIEFSTTTSMLQKIEDYPNLVVLRTLSKAWGLASARIGFAFSNASIIDLFNKVKPPYNISTLNQEAALLALENAQEMQKNKLQILHERQRLSTALQKLSIVKKIYPSEANFLLVEFSHAKNIYQNLIVKGIVVRNRHTDVANCLRISIGTPTENRTLLNELIQLEKIIEK